MTTPKTWRAQDIDGGRGVSQAQPPLTFSTTPYTSRRQDGPRVSTATKPTTKHNRSKHEYRRRSEHGREPSHSHTTGGAQANLAGKRRVKTNLVWVKQVADAVNHGQPVLVRYGLSHRAPVAVHCDAVVEVCPGRRWVRLRPVQMNESYAVFVRFDLLSQGRGRGG